MAAQEDLQKETVKKGPKTTVMSYTITTIEVSFINVSVLYQTLILQINLIIYLIPDSEKFLRI